MLDDSKTIFITHPYYAVNNPDNNFRIYKKGKNSDRWHYTQCKNKIEYQKKIKEYILGFWEYARDEEKAYTNVSDYLEKDNSSMFDYFMGGKKDEKILIEKQMKREEMAMINNGNFLTDNDAKNMSKRWSKYIDDSNIELAVLSFNQKYVDENIDIKELHKKITTDVMPKFLSYCGYEKPKENLEWIVALHNDRDNNYHFHIAWIEKNKCYKTKNNKLEHRRKLMLEEKEINFMKRQAVLTIERKKLYTPAIIELGKNLEQLKSYFNPKDCNFTLKNIKDLEFEEKIIKLGFLINEIRSTDKKYIKYNSLPKNQIGYDIRSLTKEIKRDIFKQSKMKQLTKEIENAINKINDILIDIDKRNNISKVGFENILENKLIKEKIEAEDNYILNAIVNHALYNFSYYRKKINKDNFKLEDLIDEMAYQFYKKDFKELRNKKIYYTKKKLLIRTFKGKRYKSNIEYALDRLGYEQEQAAKKFYDMFNETNEYEI